MRISTFSCDYHNKRYNHNTIVQKNAALTADADVGGLGRSWLEFDSEVSLTSSVRAPEARSVPLGRVLASGEQQDQAVTELDTQYVVTNFGMIRRTLRLDVPCELGIRHHIRLDKCFLIRE
jgi:hypothetical protein